jgi:predicted ATPase/class 3 adenylate cyclase/Tfp pilus assembly protein PilF
MNKCPFCGFHNPEEIHICLQCASAINQICHQCGGIVPMGNRFCGFCGSRLEENSNQKTTEISRKSGENNLERINNEIHARMPDNLATKISQASTKLPGQRREVTVLFARISDFNQVSKNLESESLYLALDEIMHLLAGVVYKYEGIIDKFTGDGLMALFGIPLNHENDPERAVRAALEIQQILTEQKNSLESRFNFDFPIRIGINTGSVIAGPLGDRQHLEYTVIGDTVNLANHLEAAAEPGMIMVSFNTYQRTRPIFDYLALPPHNLEDFPTPIQAYQPLTVRFAPKEIRGLPGLQVPMIGRSKDLYQLNQAFKQVVSDRNSKIVLISGEAGIGKSRLIVEFRNQITGQQVNVFTGTCAAYMRITPYRVVADILRNIINVSELDTQKVQREALQDHLDQLGLSQRDILPYLLQVLGLLDSDPLMEVRIKLLEPSMLQRQTHLALRMFLFAEAKVNPTVFIFDDLHWVDPASRQFLENLCQTLENIPILLVLVAREFEQFESARLISLAAGKHARTPLHINLVPLSASDSRLLIDQLIRETTVKANVVKTSIADRASGNPYYVEELVRILMDNGGLTQIDGNWRINNRADALIKEVPGTLQDLILARFDRLPEHLRQTLQKASTLGQSFAISLLQILCQDDPGALKTNLSELEQRDFFLHGNFGIQVGYVFKHPLLQETIYNTLLKRDLRAFHFRIAQAIENGEHWLSGERNEILAHHYAESTAPLQAIPYLLASAEKASQNFANETVVQLYRRALSLMETSPDISMLQMDEARIGLSKALKFTGPIDEAAIILEEVVYRNSLEIASHHLSDTNQLRILIEGLRELSDIRARENNLDIAVQLLHTGLNYLGNTGQDRHPIYWRRLVDRLAWVYFRQGKLEESYNLADQALLNVKTGEMDDPITVASLWNTIGGVYYTRSRLFEAIESVERSLQIYKDLNYHWGMAVSLNNLGILNFAFGKWEEAVIHLEQADRLRSEYGSDPERPINLKNLGEVLIALGDYERARAKMETSLSISDRIGMDLAKTYAELGLCHLSIKEEKYSEAQIHLQHARWLIDDKDDESDRACIYYNLELLIEARRSNLLHALDSGIKAKKIAEKSGFAGELADALRGLGLVNHLLSEYLQAETYLQESMRIAQARNDRYSEAETLFELGRLYDDWGQADLAQETTWLKQAEICLDKAINTFENLGAKQDLRRAREARSALSCGPSAGFGISDGDEVSNQVAKLRARLGLPEGEWYQAAILSVLLTPNQDEDDELIFETIAFLIPNLIELIQENGGHYVSSPDGIIVIFGAPTAHEDDPERAVETAMQLINFYSEIYLRTQLPITLRLGITMGKIIAGKIGGEMENEILAAGEPLQISRLISEVSTPARVWVTQTVRNATAFRFEYTPVTVDQHHPSAEHTLFQLEGLREQILPVRGLLGLKTAFVGRQGELSQLHHIAQKLRNGLGGLVWVYGDAGIGKSRLMREFAAQIPSDQFLVCRGSCTARSSTRAFSLFSALLSNMFDIQPNFTPAQIYSQIESRLKRWPDEIQDIRPFIQLLVGVQPSGLQAERVMELEPEQLRRQTFVSLHRLISVLAAQTPVIIILDDIQWIDSISADLLLYLSHLIGTQPVLLVCAQRHNEVTPYERTLARMRDIHPEQSANVMLEPLTMEECQVLLQEFLSTAELPDAIKSLIVHQSGGNPYYIEEFVRMLLEQDYLRTVRGRLEVNQELIVSKLAIPASLESLIRARVDSLHTAARQILQVASVIGQRFSRSLLMAVAEQENIDTYLEQLRTRGMLSLDVAAGFWEFSHPMIEAIVYNTVLRAQRRILHHRTAKALETQWRGNESEHAEELAYHFGKADEHIQAMNYMILAGERAAARHANETALSYFEQASDLFGAVPDLSDVTRYRITYGLGEVYQFVGKFDASLAILNAGKDLIHSSQLTPAQTASLNRCMGDTLRKTGDYKQAIQAFTIALEILGDPLDDESLEEAARVHVSMGWSYFMQASWDEAKASVHKAIDYALDSKATNAIAMAENLLGGIYYRQGDLGQAVIHTRQALSYWQEIGYGGGVAASMSNLGILEVSSGNWSIAYEAFQKSLNLRQEMGDVEGVAITQNNLGSLARDQGYLDQAEEYYRSSLAVSRPFQMSWHTANSSMGLAQTLLYQGRLEDAIEPLHEGIRIAGEINARDLLIEMQRTEAEVFLAEMSYQKAEQVARDAARLASEIGSSPLEASAWRVAAESLLLQEKPQEALNLLDNAWQALVQGGDKLETGRTHAQAMKIASYLGRQQLVDEHYLAARQIFELLKARRDLELLRTVSPSSTQL